jgi:uncharacterized protein DUF6946
MKRIFVPTRSGSDWQRLLAKPVLHWKKGASAMTTAAAWEAAADRVPSEISVVLDSSRNEALLDLELLAAIPEWETPLEGGATPSHTDVLALCSNRNGLCVVAVEAKVNEDFGPLMEEKRASASSDQDARLTYLQGLLRVPRFADNIRYQLIHRTAAALLTARQFHAGTAVIMVQSFGSKPSLRQDFSLFCTALNAHELAPGVLHASQFDAPRLFLAWCDGDKEFLRVELPTAL